MHDCVRRLAMEEEGVSAIEHIAECIDPLIANEGNVQLQSKQLAESC